MRVTRSRLALILIGMIVAQVVVIIWGLVVSIVADVVLGLMLVVENFLVRQLK